MFSVLQIKSDKSFSMKKERIPVLFFFFFLHKTELLYVLHKTEFPQVLLMISVVSVRFHL